jgi:hypothetical protein
MGSASLRGIAGIIKILRRGAITGRNTDNVHRASARGADIHEIGEQDCGICRDHTRIPGYISGATDRGLSSDRSLRYERAAGIDSPGSRDISRYKIRC